MSYRRKKRYKRKRRGYHPYIKASAPAVGYVAAKVAEKVVKKYVNTEVKYHDTQMSAQVIGSGGHVTFLNGIARGDESYQREGYQYRAKSMTIQGHVKMNAAASNTIIRMAVVQVFRPDGSNISINDVWDSTVNGAAIAVSDNDPNRFRNISNTKGMKVIWTKKILINEVGPASAKFKCHVDLGSIVRWEEGSALGTIAAIKDNAFFFCAISNEDTNDAIVSYLHRHRFIDN